MAGLGAATTLQEKGYSVIVLEAQSRPGGRVYTDYGTFAVPVEMGAQWIHGVDGNPLTGMTKILNADHFTTDYSNLKIYDVDTEMSDSAIRAFQSDYEKVTDEVAKMQDVGHINLSLASALEASYIKFGFTPTQQRYSNFAQVDNVELEYATSSEKLSLWWFDQDDELDGDDWWLPEGYDRLPGRLAGGLDVRYNQSVTAVDYSAGSSSEDEDGDVVVVTKEDVFNCSQVVVAVPLGILKNGNISFIPSLPSSLNHAIGRLEMGLLEKHFVQFNETFWSTVTEFLYILDEDISRYNMSTYSEIFNVAHYLPETNMLCLFSSGDAAFDQEMLSEEGRMNQLMARLRQVWPSAPDPVGHVFSSWGTDEFTYGSYSSIGVGGSVDDRDAFRHAVSAEGEVAKGTGVMSFAGEHTSLCFPSTVHGAYWSGVNAANVLLGKGQDDLCSYKKKWYETLAFILGCVGGLVCLVVGAVLFVYRKKLSAFCVTYRKKTRHVELPTSA